MNINHLKRGVVDMTIAQQLKITKFPFIIKNENGKEIYFEDSEGYWWKRELDTKGVVAYWEDSFGNIYDNSPDKVVVVQGVKYKLVKI